MVRLVFRPYTQIWRSICTSEPLRASIRVSSDFALFRHSSPSFGSQHMRSYSDLSKESRPVDGAPLRDPTYIYFHFALGFNTQTLAHVLDSLVRVSRRVVWDHFVNIQNSEWKLTSLSWQVKQSTSCLPNRVQDRHGTRNKVRGLSPGRSIPWGYNAKATFLKVWTSTQTGVDLDKHKVHLSADSRNPILVSSVSLLTISRTI